MGPTATTPFVNALVSGQLASPYFTSSSPPAPAAKPAPTPTAQGVYWQGQDGNYYTKIAGQNGVQNVGKSYTAPKGVSQIQDPDPGGVQPGSTNAGTGTAASGSGTTYQDKSNDIAMQEAGLGAVDNGTNTGVANVNKALSTIMGEYDSDAAAAKSDYGNESNSNQTDLQTNKQTALEDAVQGRQGLYSTLASLGALNGTGLELANNAVQKGANSDLTTAADTFATNQNALDTGYNAFTRQDEQRRTQAQTNAANDIEQIQNDAAKSRQAYLTNLANDYQAEGNTDQAKNFAGQAAALFPAISSTNVPQIDIGYSGSAYTAPTLSQYVGKANNTTVQTTAPQPGSGVLNIPGLIAINKKQS